MDRQITLYHGSQSIVDHPMFGAGKKNNDFGYGFYCTENALLAKEWAVSNLKDGYANRYTLNTEYLKILNLNTPEYTVLNWIAVLIEHRIFSVNTPVASRARRYLIDHFSVNVDAYDVIIGDRADDSYFDYAEAFLNNGISVEQLSLAMRLGKLGEQIVIRSEFAFSNLKYEGSEKAPANQYYPYRRDREEEANILYRQMLEEDDDGLYIRDIIRGGITNEDPRIPGNVCKQSSKSTW